MSLATFDIFFAAGAFGLVTIATIGVALVAAEQRRLVHRLGRLLGPEPARPRGGARVLA